MLRLLRRFRDTRWEARELKRVPRLDGRVERLLPESEVWLDEVFGSREVEARWRAAAAGLGEFEIPDGTGGVNPGDRRAIFYLLSYFKFSSVLEVGTHIGASTVHAAAALRGNVEAGGAAPALVSVDARAVNDPVAKPWVQHGAKYSPAEMVERAGCGRFTEFVTQPSLDYMAGSRRKFQLVFLDGEHAAKTVYREIPAALELLEEGGLILLHDYFPGLRPLWSDGSVVPGPFLATKRFLKEGARFKVLPLGRLPWPTKLNSNVTSLALLSGRATAGRRG
jgi:predicted O-methyltransferase YrrM